MSIIDQLNQLIDSTEFSDRVKDKVKELLAKANLRKESGADDENCLTFEEKNEFMQLVKADMILDGLRARACKAYLSEIDRIILGLER